jgi:dihydrofolate reductase
LHDTVTPTNAPTATGVSAADAKPPAAIVTIIAAIAANGVIGNNNALPWRLREDLQRFRRLTTGHTIVMGRKTFESLGRLLPERTHIIVSRNDAFAPAGCLVAHSLADAFALCSGQDEVFVIGGADVYRQTLPCADRLQLTEIHRDFTGDALFPAIVRSDWRETSRERHHADTGFDYDFVIYERN